MECPPECVNPFLALNSPSVSQPILSPTLVWSPRKGLLKSIYRILRLIIQTGWYLDLFPTLPSKRKIPKYPSRPKNLGEDWLPSSLIGYSCTSYKLILLSQHLPLDLKLPMGSGLPRVFLEYPASLLGDPWLMVAEKN